MFIRLVLRYLTNRARPRECISRTAIGDVLEGNVMMRMRQVAAATSMVLAAALVAAGCGGSDDSSSDSGSSGSGGSSKAAYKPTADDWATFGYDAGNTRHVPFTKITKDNVKTLGLAYVTDLKDTDDSIPGGQQSYPLAIDGKLYVTTSFNHAFAIDAETGDVAWHTAPGKIGSFKNFGVTANRGMAYCDGSLFQLTLDMRILKYDIDSGKITQEAKISDDVKDAKPEFGYYESSAPTCYDGVLYVGSSGADNGVRGFVMAYDPDDLSPAWSEPHWNVPPEGQDWRAKGRFHGGGSVWMPTSYDEASDTLYFQSANPSPDFYATLRPGKNPNTNSLIAVDAKTGKDKWIQQQLAPDEWDYDTDQTPLVYDATVGGATRRVVSVGTKEGKVFVYDAKTGTPIYNGIEVIDKIDHPRLKPGVPVTIFPSALGGLNYATPSYDPDANTLVVNAAETSATFIQTKSIEAIEKDRVRGDVDTGTENGFGTTPKGRDDYGTIRGIDLATGKLKWRVEVPEVERGGTTTTATGLAFTGGGDGVLRALDTATGRELWKFQTGSQIAAAPTIFQTGGEEYVAITLGGTITSSNGGKDTKLAVFELGGTTKQATAPVVKAPAQSQENVAATAQQDRNPLAAFLEPTAGADGKPADKQLTLTLVGGQGKTGGGLDFNGYQRGKLVYTVPKGWQINGVFKNSSAQMPHSAYVTEYDNREDSNDFPLAFEGAATDEPYQGILSGTQNFTFTPDKTGTYAIVCAVPGHAAGGMWVTLKVVDGEEASVEADGTTFDLKLGSVETQTGDQNT